MNGIAKAASAGIAGAIATNVAHEVVRRSTESAPRVDLLGMEALSGMLRSTGIQPPKGRALYSSTLLADLVSNGAYFASVGGRGGRPLMRGLLLGLAAGVGAVALPPVMKLSSETTSRTGTTALLSVGLYTLGGVIAGLTYEALS